jgi:hypothetical protein
MTNEHSNVEEKVRRFIITVVCAVPVGNKVIINLVLPIRLLSRLLIEIFVIKTDAR